LSLRFSHPHPPSFGIHLPAHLKCLCVERITEKFQPTKHEIIVTRANEDVMAHLNGFREAGLSHTHSDTNAGVCYGLQWPFVPLATSKYIILSDDDYITLPLGTSALLREAQSQKDIYFLPITGTMIEHSASRYDSMYCESKLWQTLDRVRREKISRRIQHMYFSRPWNGGNGTPMLLHNKFGILLWIEGRIFSGVWASAPDMMMSYALRCEIL